MRSRLMGAVIFLFMCACVIYYAATIITVGAQAIAAKEAVTQRVTGGQ